MDFAVPKDLARPANRVVLGMIKTVVIIHVSPDLGCKEFRVEWYVLGPRITVQPGEIGKRKRIRLPRLGRARFTFFRDLRRNRSDAITRRGLWVRRRGSG